MTRTKELDFNARHDPKTALYCCKCQKDLDPRKPHRMVHIIAGGWRVLHPADEGEYAEVAKAMGGAPDDLGCHPIGNDCARKLGLEWSWPA